MLREFRTEIEYELIRLGLRLRDVGAPGFNLRDLYVVATHPAKDGPLGRAMSRKISGEASDWSVSEHLLASAVDALNWLVWSKTEDGAKNRRLPKPIPRPGASTASDERRVKGTGMTVEEAMDLF